MGYYEDYSHCLLYTSQARRVISSTANLTFRDVNDNLLMDASVLKEGGDVYKRQALSSNGRLLY